MSERELPKPEYPIVKEKSQDTIFDSTFEWAVHYRSKLTLQEIEQVNKEKLGHTWGWCDMVTFSHTHYSMGWPLDEVMTVIDRLFKRQGGLGGDYRIIATIADDAGYVDRFEKELGKKVIFVPYLSGVVYREEYGSFSSEKGAKSIKRIPVPCRTVTLKKKFKGRIISWSNSGDDFGWIVDGSKVDSDEAFYEWKNWDDVPFDDDIISEMKKDMGNSKKDFGMRVTEWLTRVS